MTSSTRLMNSGRNCCFRMSITWLVISCWLASSPVSSMMAWLPRLLVITTMVLLKSTVRP